MDKLKTTAIAVSLIRSALDTEGDRPSLDHNTTFIAIAGYMVASAHAVDEECGDPSVYAKELVRGIADLVDELLAKPDIRQACLDLLLLAGIHQKDVAVGE